MTREIIEYGLCDKLFMDLHPCAHLVLINDLLLNKRNCMDISEQDITGVIYRQAHTNIREQDLNRKGYFPKGLPRTYKQTYIVVRLFTTFRMMVYPSTYELDSDPEVLICTQKY